jgi:cytochrome b pre-mRNA-processing protein 3
VRRALNPLKRLLRRSKAADDSAILYGAIVAQARLPAFYRVFAVPDTLEGRFTLLGLHLFAVLHRLRSGGSEARDLAQSLMDRFIRDMETVLREQGVSDLKIPKTMRRLAGANLARLQAYEEALGQGRDALAAEVAAALPMADDEARIAAGRLAAYVEVMVISMEKVPLASLREGEVAFPDPGASLA